MTLHTSPQDTPWMQSMLDGQLRPHGLCQPLILERVKALPRDAFVLGSAQNCGAAYADTPCPLTETRSLLPVRAVARMVEALNLKPESRVLVLAAGTGYEAAFLAPFASEVVACEDDGALQPLLRKNLRGMENVSVLPNGPLQVPASSQPFTHVVLGAPFEVLPQALLKKLFTPVVVAGVRVQPSGLSTALVMHHQGHTWLEDVLCECPAGPAHPQLRASEAFIF